MLKEKIEQEHCNKCGKLTGHYHIGFLGGAKHFVCRDCCPYKECKDPEHRKTQFHGDID